MSGRPVAEWQLGNFGQSASVSIPLGMRLDVWNDSPYTFTFTLNARNGQSIMGGLLQNAAISLSGRLFSSIALNSPNSSTIWALVDEGSPLTWGPVTGQPASPPAVRITDAFGNPLPQDWAGSPAGGTAPSAGRFFGYVVASAAGAITMSVGLQPAFTIATATAAGQSFPFSVYVQVGEEVNVTNAVIEASGISL
jgi:hypothetical protein